MRNGERDKDRFKESSEIIEYVTSDVTQADMEVSLDFTMMDKVSLTFDPFNMTSYRVKNRENFETKYLQRFEAFGWQGLFVHIIWNFDHLLYENPSYIDRK